SDQAAALASSESHPANAGPQVERFKNFATSSSTASSSVPAGAQKTGKATRVPTDERLRNLEGTLETLLKEIKELRGEMNRTAPSSRNQGGGDYIRAKPADNKGW